MWSFHTIKTPSNLTQKLHKLNYHNTGKYELIANSIELISTRYRSIHSEQFEILIDFIDQSDKIAYRGFVY